MITNDMLEETGLIGGGLENLTVKFDMCTEQS